jgi:hypothetical protein
MTVIIQRRDPETDALNDVGRIDSGEIVEGEDRLADLFPEDGVPGDDALLDRFRGPTLFAARAEAAEAASRAATPFGDVEVIPDAQERLNKDALVLWVTWVRQGRPRAENFDPNREVDPSTALEGRSFNPSLHPRGPDGKFVERPWDIPDSLEIDGLRTTPTLSLLKELDNAGEPIEDVMADPDIRIDGIPDDVNSISEAEERMGGDGLAFQDLELNDQVEIVADDGQLTKGAVKKTEQIDGAPNRATVISDTGTTYVTDIPDGTTVRRTSGPVLPPSEVTKKEPLTHQSLNIGDKVAVTTGYQTQDTPTFEGVGNAEASVDANLKEGIEVNGDVYDPDHPNIQVFDAEPDDVEANDVQEGDIVSAWTGHGGAKIAEGEVTDVTDVGDNQYATIVDQTEGEEVQVNLDTQELKDPLSVPSTEDFDAVNEDDPDLDPSDGVDDVGEYLDETSPEDVSVSDVEDSLVSINSQDVEPDDWVAWADSWDGDVENVGKVSDVSQGGQNMLVNQSGSIDDLPTHQDKLHRVQTDVDTSEIAPGSIDADDISVSNTTEVTPPDEPGPSMADLDEGDFVSVDPGITDIKVGRVTSDTDNDVGTIIIDPGEGEGSEGASLANNEVRLIDDAAVVDAGADEPPITFQSSEADGIDPSTVSGSALNSDQVDAYSFADSQEGDWVIYEDEDGDEHAGQVVAPGPSQLNINTGHTSDPQLVDDDQGVRGIDASAVTDTGSPPGSSKTTTGGTSAPTSDYDVDDIASTPNATEPDPDDLQRAVIADDDGSIGMIDGDTVQAFQEFMADPDQGGQDILSSSQSSTTSRNNLSMPRNNWTAVRDHVAHFAQETEGINAPEANDRAASLISKISTWKGKSYNDNGQTIERWFHGGVDLPGDYRNDGLQGQDPDDSAAAVSALMTAATQGFLRENFDDIETHDLFGQDSDPDDNELSMYRGIGRTAISSLAKDWASEPDADRHSVKESKVTNWTTDSGVADKFSTDGHQLKKSAQIEDAIFSPDLMTGSKTGISSESEIWFTGGVSDAPAENIRVDGTGENVMTMADLNAPEEMGHEQLQIVTNWAKRMNEKDVTLDTQEQIDTFRRARDEAMDNAAVADSYANKISQVIKKSEQAISQPGPDAVEAE